MESDMQVTPYLYFRGACEDALKFYEASGLGSIKLLQRYEGTPMAERDGGAWGTRFCILCSRVQAFGCLQATVRTRSR
jgi:PhnB protein